MKVIIDIPKKDYDKMCKGELINTILVAIKNGTPIPDNATNGEMLMTMFSDERGEHFSYLTPLHLMYDGLDFIKEFRIEWWNAPYNYNKEVEE